MCKNYKANKFDIPNQETKKRARTERMKEWKRESARKRREKLKSRDNEDPAIATSSSLFCSISSEPLIRETSLTPQERDEVEIEKVVPLYYNEIVFDEKLMEFCNRHGLLRVDVPGAGDCQLHAAAVSHFNENITLDLKNYEKLTKLKRSIINLNQKHKNKFNIQNHSKHQEWRKHTVGEILPKALWMNDEDMRVCSYIF